MTASLRSPCPCCGHLVHDGPTGSSLICPICRWEGDLLQLRWPKYEGGANKVFLIQAQLHFRAVGAKQVDRTKLARRPRDDEPVDDGFRPIDLSIDSFEETLVQEASWPDDGAVLYWWRPTFWRRLKGVIDK